MFCCGFGFYSFVFEKGSSGGDAIRGELLEDVVKEGVGRSGAFDGQREEIAAQLVGSKVRRGAVRG